MLYVAFRLGERVALLAMFDLGIHELGHLLFRPFGMVASFIMGSGLQVLVPLALASYFWIRQRDHVAAGWLMTWGATSMQDTSVYIADAPHRALQLIGGTHDWWWLLRRWDRLDLADEIASGVWGIGLVLGLAGMALILWPAAKELWVWSGKGAAISVPGTPTVREPRRPPR
jgi:hypothetical protein